jgi:DMSO/TMAO reductase YedYZ heme-binding membrane subunit
MATTSNDRAVRALGPWWHRIHRTGIHYLWFFFVISFVLGLQRMSELGNPRVGMLYFFIGIMLAGLGLRIFLYLRRRSS